MPELPRGEASRLVAERGALDRAVVGSDVLATRHLDLPTGRARAVAGSLR